MYWLVSAKYLLKIIKVEIWANLHWTDTNQYLTHI